MSQGRKPEDEEGLTSEEIFGDLVDAAASAGAKPTSKTPAQRPGVIKVKVAEKRSATVGPSDPLPEELAALIDAFDGKKAEAEIPAPPPEPSSHPPTPATPTEPETPTPLALEALPDLPEIEGSRGPGAEAEVRGDFLKLTSLVKRMQ